MPVIIEPVKIPWQYVLCFQFSYYGFGDFCSGQEPAKEGAAVARRIWNATETHFRHLLQYSFQLCVVGALFRQEFFQTAYLCQSNGCMQFRNTVIITNERMQIGPTINAFMVVSMIAVAIAVDVYIFPISDHST